MTSCSVTCFKKAISEISRRFCADSTSEKSDPLFLSGQLSKVSGRSSVSNIRPDDMAIPFGLLLVSRSFEQFKVAFFQTSWKHARTLFRVQEDSNVPVHPSGQRGNTVRMSELEENYVFLYRHRY
jgi:hypothetical protein